MRIAGSRRCRISISRGLSSISEIGVIRRLWVVVAGKRTAAELFDTIRKGIAGIEHPLWRETGQRKDRVGLVFGCTEALYVVLEC